MKKTILLSLCFVLIVGMASTSSCKKDNKIRGCTDIDSKNYDPTAQENDGSCLYEGSIVFWYDKTASDGLIADGATALTFSLSGQIVGSCATSLYWTAAPSCGQNGAVTVLEDLGKVKTHAYTLSIKDQTGFEYLNTLVNIDANTCLQFQMNWTTKKK